jgi:hypothetical protein
MANARKSVDVEGRNLMTDLSRSDDRATPKLISMPVLRCEQGIQVNGAPRSTPWMVYVCQLWAPWRCPRTPNSSAGAQSARGWAAEPAFDQTSGVPLAILVRSEGPMDQPGYMSQGSARWRSLYADLMSGPEQSRRLDRIAEARSAILDLAEEILTHSSSEA